MVSILQHCFTRLYILHCLFLKISWRVIIIEGQTAGRRVNCDTHFKLLSCLVDGNRGLQYNQQEIKSWVSPPASEGIKTVHTISYEKAGYSNYIGWTLFLRSREYDIAFMTEFDEYHFIHQDIFTAEGTRVGWAHVRNRE